MVATLRQFDFNGSGNYTAAGYIGLRGNTTYTAALGYGWNAAVSENQRAITSPTNPSGYPQAFFRDGHVGLMGDAGARTFYFDVNPGASYTIVVWFGDSGYYRDYQTCKLDTDVAYQPIVSCLTNQFLSITLNNCSDTNGDGKIGVTVYDSGGRDRYWITNGMIVTEIVPIVTTINVPCGQLSLTPKYPSINIQSGGTTTVITIASGSLALTGHAPVINELITIESGSLTLTGHAPTLNRRIIASGSLSLTGHAPTLSTAITTRATVPSGSLTLTGHSPTLNRRIIAYGSLALTGYAPATKSTIIISKGSLLLTNYPLAINIKICISAKAMTLKPHHITITTTAYDFAIYDIVDTTKQSDKPELPREQPATPVNNPIPSGSRYEKYNTPINKISIRLKPHSAAPDSLGEMIEI